MIEQLNSKNIDMLRTEINEAIEKVANKNGIAIKIGNISYSDFKFTTRLTVETSGNDAREFERYAKVMGIDPDIFGKQFVHKSIAYKVTGLNPSAPKYPINYKGITDGRRYKATKDFLNKVRWI